MESEAHIRECFPELDLIESSSLRSKVVDSWKIALEDGEFDRLDEVPGLPMIDASSINNVEHTRGVTTLAKAIAQSIGSTTDADLNMDYVVAGALCHDTGKPFEFAELDRGEYIGVAWESSQATIRHPVVGAAIAWSVDMPWDIVHIVATHSMEGRHVIRSPESNIVHHADYVWWSVAIEQTFGMSIEELVFQE